MNQQLSIFDFLEAVPPTLKEFDHIGGDNTICYYTKSDLKDGQVLRLIEFNERYYLGFCKKYRAFKIIPYAYKGLKDEDINKYLDELEGMLKASKERI